MTFGLFWLLGISLVLGLLGALRPACCLVAFDLVVAGLVAATRLRRRTVAPPRATAAVGTGPDGHGRRGGRAPAAGSPPCTCPAAARPGGRCRGRPWWRSAWPPRPSSCAVLGAHRLNAGGTWALTGVGLAAGAAALLLVAAAARANADSRSDRAVLPAAAAVIYLLGLAVLLATSLRGIGVTGHDIKPEFRVFQDTLAAGAWNPGGTLADYMSCLSITTLPTFLHHLLGVAPLDVFRVCYQVIFAAVPVGVLLIARTLVPTAAATLAAGLYVAFPTFVNDMPMLNRQEIALLFFTVAVLTLLDRHGSRRQRTAIFAAMIAGLTVSHYSSTYVTGGVMLAAWSLLRAGHLMRRRDRTPDGRAARLLGRVDRLLARVSLRRSAWAGPHLLNLRTVVIVLLVLGRVEFRQRQRGRAAHHDRRRRSPRWRPIRAPSRTRSATASCAQAPAVSDEQALGEFIAANGNPSPRPSGSGSYATVCPSVLQPEPVIPPTAVGHALASAGAAPGPRSTAGRASSPWCSTSSARSPARCCCGCSAAARSARRTSWPCSAPAP